MKIGILTFHRALNYGAVLQCYALQKFITDLGYDVEIIDYRPAQIENAYKLIKANNVKSFISSVYHFQERYKAREKFSKFRSDFLQISNKQYYKDSDFKNDYDYYLIGSDQVWSIRINKGFDSIYWGNFAPNSRKISYAASMGNHEPFSEEEIMSIRKQLANFSAISVREDFTRKELQNLTSKEIFTVLDPTLLNDKSVYEKISILPKEQDYVLYYQQEYNPHAKILIEDVCRQLHCKVVVVTGVIEKYDIDYCYYNLDNISISYFLGLFRGAKCVFTSSFHGTAFSLIFNKNFYFLKNAAIERAINLLSLLDVTDRAIEPTNRVQFSSIDYSTINQKLKVLKEYSGNFLIKELQS